MPKKAIDAFKKADSMPNMVAGLIWDFNTELIAPFFNSLKRSGFDGKCVIFVYNVPADTISFLQANNVEIIEINPRTYTPHHLVNARFLAYRDYFQDLAKSDDLPDAVLFTDIRDVVFQGDPFSNYEEGLNCYLETRRIADCKKNTGWLREAFGSEAVEHIKEKDVICCGTIIVAGSHILDFLETMGNVLESLPVTAKALTSEQAALNYIVYNGLFDSIFLHECGDHVMTMRSDGSSNHIVTEDSILNSAGNACPIVHAYDRDWAAVQAMGKRLGINEMPFEVRRPKHRQAWLLRVTKQARRAVLNVARWPVDRLVAIFRADK